MGEQAEDPLDGLEERLQSHTKAFESLLALTPARDHYGSQIDDGLDPSEQWNRKKQTKEQKRAAKKAKLDPANQKTALDVMRERELKRKRELGIEDDGPEASLERSNQEPTKKKQKQEPTQRDDDEAIRRAKAEKRKAKRDVKKQKAADKKAKQEAKKAAKQDEDLAELGADDQEASVGANKREDDLSEAEEAEAEAEMGAMDFSGLSGPDKDDDDGAEANEDEEEANDDDEEASSAPSSPEVNSPAFDISTNHSEASSSSSIVPPSITEQTKAQMQTQPPPAKSTLKIDLSTIRPATSTKQKSLPKFNDITSGTSSPKLQLPDIDTAELQERLRKRIEELRQKRKADGPDGKPARSRQELLDQRRKKEEQRKAHKKELRRQAKEEEAQKREEQLRGSGSPLSVDIFSRNSPRPKENNFSFTRLAFDDGTAADASLSELRDPRKKKGPQDPRTALEAAEKKQSRLAGLDAEKRADIADKDMWLNAKKRAHGERVRDDTSLLKKALKRKEKQKNKSEKEWRERESAVVKGREMKQKKRDANLQKRRDEKGQKGKKKPSSGKSKKKARPGFEGRGFKA